MVRHLATSEESDWTDEDRWAAIEWLARQEDLNSHSLSLGCIIWLLVAVVFFTVGAKVLHG
jgi:hypothetical protein